jgi:hypothetical protein
MSIRVAFSEHFKGKNTLLIDIDRDGLHDLIAWLRGMTSAGRNATLTDLKGVDVQPGVRVAMVCTTIDAGMARASETQFVWRRSADGWIDIVEKLAEMETGACHRYLDGPRDDVQVMARALHQR